MRSLRVFLTLTLLQNDKDITLAVIVSDLDTTMFAQAVNPQKPVPTLGIAYVFVEGFVNVPRYEIRLRRGVAIIMVRMEFSWA